MPTQLLCIRHDVIMKLLLLCVLLTVQIPDSEGMRGTLYRSGRSGRAVSLQNYYRSGPSTAALMFAVPQDKEYQEFLRFGRSLYDVADNLQVRSQRGLTPQEQERTTVDMDADDGQMLRFG